MNSFQVTIGIILFILGIGMGYNSLSMPTYVLEGIMLGQCSVLVLWGIREVIGGILR